MTSTVAEVPPAIGRALRGLNGLDACVVETEPRYDAEGRRWVVTLTLHRTSGAPFIASSTRWCVLIDESYPLGRVAIHPAAEGGVTATFPHQSRNTTALGKRAWRGGNLCLDAPLGRERGASMDRDPLGEADLRLRWHLERAMLWLDRAADGRLLGTDDPFELPARPHTTARGWLRRRVVHDETAATFGSWVGRGGTFGRCDFGSITNVGNAIGVSSFQDQNGVAIRDWRGRPLTKCDDLAGFWWLCKQPVVLPPWQAPATWGELRRVARSMGLDVDAVLRWLLPALRGTSTSNLLLLGYPVPLRIDAPVTEVHWDAVVLPPIKAAAGKPPAGFRPNHRGWWQRDRYGIFKDSAALECVYTENWSAERLRARGRLPSSVRDLRVVLLGVGALGSMLAEMLARAGLQEIALVDDDLVEAGNICRHVATLSDTGTPKVEVVAKRLRQISPEVRVTEMNARAEGDVRSIIAQLDEFDVIIDCTASDEILRYLASAWWPIPRTFASFSLGRGGKRLFSFGTTGNEFPHGAFAAAVRPWLEQEAATWSPTDEVLEGAGCWSPLFPARHDDVMLAAATCVKELESLVANRTSTHRYRVFAQVLSDDGFGGFVVQARPPALEAIAP